MCVCVHVCVCLREAVCSSQMKALPHHFWFSKLLDSLLHIRNENLWLLNLVESSPFIVVQTLVHVSL